MKNAYNICKKYTKYHIKAFTIIFVLYLGALLPAFLQQSSTFILTLASNFYLLLIHSGFIYILHRLFENYPDTTEKIKLRDIFGLFKENKLYAYIVPLSALGLVFLTLISNFLNMLVSFSNVPLFETEEETYAYFSSMPDGEMLKYVGLIIAIYSILMLSAWFFDIYATEFYYRNEGRLLKKSGESLKGTWNNLWDYTKVSFHFIPWFVLVIITFGFAGVFVFPYFRLCFSEIARNKWNPGLKAGDINTGSKNRENKGKIIEA